MDNKKNSKIKIIWLSVLILFICVAVTTIAFADVMDIFLPDDSGAISLLSEEAQETEDNAVQETKDDSTQVTEDSAGQEATEEATLNPPTEVSTENTTSTEPQATEEVKNPSFEVSDDKTVWDTNTQIDLFNVSYENAEQIITVKSEDGTKVIAPGTENTYTFKLKNTGNVALDYTVEIEAYFEPADISIPITGRICRYDGSWVAGGKDSFATVAELNQAVDSATLGAGKFTYYTLDWIWPFEGENDELDTLLGNLAAQQDITFTIVIKTTATESSDPNDDSGITPPKTGDNSNLTLWIGLMIFSFVMIIFLIFAALKEKRRDEAEAENS